MKSRQALEKAQDIIEDVKDEYDNEEVRSDLEKFLRSLGIDLEEE